MGVVGRAVVAFRFVPCCGGRGRDWYLVGFSKNKLTAWVMSPLESWRRAERAWVETLSPKMDLREVMRWPYGVCVVVGGIGEFIS